jgi:hypothetical protein
MDSIPGARKRHPHLPRCACADLRFARPPLHSGEGTHRLHLPPLNGSFTGSMSADHSSISGQWTQAKSDNSGFAGQTLTLTRAVTGNAWAIPPPLGSDAKIMAADLDPTFEVATVKPHDPKIMGGGWRWIGARRFRATLPVGALLADIYGLQRDHFQAHVCQIIRSAVCHINRQATLSDRSGLTTWTIDNSTDLRQRTSRYMHFLQSDTVIHRNCDFLLRAKVALRCLDRGSGQAGT